MAKRIRRLMRNRRQRVYEIHFTEAWHFDDGRVLDRHFIWPSSPVDKDTLRAMFPEVPVVDSFEDGAYPGDT